MMRLLQIFLYQVARYSLSILSGIFSPLFSLIAKTGYGTDFCLRNGFLPLPIHYYTPVPDIMVLKDQNYWMKNRLVDMPGIDLALNNQFGLLTELGQKYSSECIWSETPYNSSDGYFTQNPSFGYSSACLLHSMIRLYKPKSVIEVGSGYSTILISNAIQKNHQETGIQSEFTAIEPYPNKLLINNELGLTEFIQEKVENIPPSHFEHLEKNDLLFIDSSHVIRIGGDINFLYLNILPRLQPGVVVHIHDIYFPYDYPEIHYVGRKKYLWTEQYILQAFLAHNPNYSVLLCGYWLQKDFSEQFNTAFPKYDPKVDRPSSSFYMICRS